VPVQPAAAIRSAHLSWLRLPYVLYIALAQMLLFAWHIGALLRSCKVDALLVGHLYLAPLARMLVWRKHCPYVVLLHGGELHRYWHLAPVRILMLWALNGAAFLVVNSNHTKEQYRARGVRHSVPIHLLAPGVESERFSEDDSVGRDLPATLAHGGKPILLSVGRLVPWKGQDTVLAALPYVRRRCPNVRYIIVGDGPYRASLEILAKELGVADRVTFAGFVAEEDLPAYYRACDLVVLPSREVQPGVPIEGFGITLMEAAAAGKAVVAGNVGGTQDAVVDGETGLLVEPTSADAVAEAIVSLLAEPERAARMGRAGQVRARASFTWPAQAAKLRALLHGATPA
jgi:phosphatidylinositol alpha-1,6-mannosyltransferase